MTPASLILADIKESLKDELKALIRGRPQAPKLKSRIPVWKIKRLIRQEGLALDEAGRPTWFYNAYRRGDSDPLTNFTLDWICREIPKESELLITGCGTGIMLFYLMDQGFTNVEGFDFLSKCVVIANGIAKLGGYHTTIRQDDGFKPTLTKQYHLITAMHWVFSAWMGNYGNRSISLDEARSTSTRNKLLVDLLSRYAPHLYRDGILIVELTDAVADYRVPLDGGVKPIPIADIYVVRHTPEQVHACAEQCGLKVLSYKMCCSYGHQPRTSYVLQKK